MKKQRNTKKKERMSVYIINIKLIGLTQANLR